MTFSKNNPENVASCFVAHRCTVKPACLVASAFMLAFFAPTVAWADRSAEDIASARQLYNEGISLRDRGEIHAALAKFKAAHALGNTPLTGVELCRTHATLNQPIEAREACLSVARIEVSPQESARSAEARKRAAEMAEEQKFRIGGVRIRLVGQDSTSAIVVSVDGVRVPQEALSEPRAVNPGLHTVTAVSGSERPVEVRIDVGAGEVKNVSLDVSVSESGARSSKPMPTFAKVSFVVAGLAAGAGVVFGARALVLEGRLRDECPRNICGRDAWENLSAAQSAGNTSTALFALAALAAGGGGFSLFMNRQRPSSSRASTAPTSTLASTSASIGLEGVVLRGSF
jgi:hypothetical protein